MNQFGVRYFVRAGVFAGDPIRICFYDEDESGDGRTLKALKGLLYSKQVEAQAECDLQNLAFDIRGIFKGLGLHDLTARVVEPQSVGFRGRERSVVAFAGRAALLTFGTGAEAYERADAWAKEVAVARAAAWKPLVKPDRADYYQRDLYSLAAEVEGKIGDAISEFEDCIATLDIMDNRTAFAENGAMLQFFRDRLKTATKALSQILESQTGDPVAGGEADEETFYRLRGLRSMTDLCFKDGDDDAETSWIDGFDAESSDDARTAAETRFVERMREKWEDDERRISREERMSAEYDDADDEQEG